LIFIRDKLTYEEVLERFEKEGYSLLSSEYKNAKGNLKVISPFDHEWTTNISNFNFGRRCSVCSGKKKYALEEVKSIFAREGYWVQDSIYINGKTPIKVSCPNGHQTEINLNNYINGRRCGSCRRSETIKARTIKLGAKAKSVEVVPRCETSVASADNGSTSREAKEQLKLEWLIKHDEMRKNLRSAKRHTYREQGMIDNIRGKEWSG
jgi:hypothetical protein